jgi:uncharacterized membrane protein YfcA
MPDYYPLAAAILLGAYFIRGITGFGSGLIAIPLLAHFLPLSFVVPMMLVLDLVASVALTRHTRLQVHWDEIGSLLRAGRSRRAGGVRAPNARRRMRERRTRWRPAGLA